MKRTFRELAFSLVAGILLMTGTQSAFASEWTEMVQIVSLQSIRADAANTISIPGTCVNSPYAYLDPSESNHKEVLSLLIAAMMAEKEVKLLCSDTCASTNRCRVIEVQVFK